MKYFLRGVYLLYLMAPIACSLSTHQLYQRATLLLGHPPQQMVESPQLFEDDAIFSQIDQTTSTLTGICWLLFLFASIPVLTSLLWPVSFRSRWLRIGVLTAFSCAWWQWGVSAEGGWYMD